MKGMYLVEWNAMTLLIHMGGVGVCQARQKVESFCSHKYLWVSHKGNAILFSKLEKIIGIYFFTHLKLRVSLFTFVSVKNI